MSSNNPYSTAVFLKSAPDLERCPNDMLAEVAFAGRSNAGKSSAINALTGQKKLARTSKTPGRTQLINYFCFENQKALVDLPGYGYAKVSLNTKRQWDRNLSAYLQGRKPLKGLVLLMDIRNPMKEFDSMLINWAVEANIPTRILLTKADKLKKGPAKSVELSLKRTLKQAQVNDLVSVQLFSSLKRDGIRDLIAWLNTWFVELPESSVCVSASPADVPA